ncbi:MAG TPA: TIGR03668 family PPOX class F420-dependent oxidoreductase [Candidatus Limnocylindrales bacterium]|nr:TIGR03668 family PPOX class F420-dependent oxidoreductase [Candidatus Limnocylindrales bacterium]
MPPLAPGEAWRRLRAARVAYLATVREDGRPHVVPIVFAVDEDRTIYSSADPKPKDGLDLLRHRNIAANPSVSLLADAYDEVWERLWWVRADGVARVVTDGTERNTAIRLLRAKYPQYATWSAPFGAATVITVERIASWTM